ncbi:Csn12 family like protein [Babesia gibsoni]|uniref:Csn12 family like protein n=1 Tax=Babesia gibsoni TaxID=33632 RepID=A0AAD8PFQ4_BABGI|nr:Csn12 family like protein [Babesia gibsoni]
MAPSALVKALELWTKDFIMAVDAQDGPALARLIRVKCDKLQLQRTSGVDENKIENYCQTHLSKYDSIYGPEMRQFLTHYFKVSILISNNMAPWDEILKKAFKLLDLWMDLYLSLVSIEYNWLVPALHSMCNLISKIGNKADKCGDSAGGYNDTDDDDKDKHMKQVLSNVRSKMGRVRGDDTRHPAYIILLGQSIKGCIQLGNMQMAAGFLKTIESHAINFSRSLRGPLINYRYYLGKLHMQKGDYLEAEEHLCWAFSNTLKDSLKMRRHILECIIVVRMGLGKLPSEDLLKKYELSHYSNILRAMKLGDVKLFSDTVDKHSDEFTMQGTILCVEQMKYIAYRTLIKNAKTWWNTNVPKAKPNMLSVQLLTAVLKLQIKDMTNEELLCILVNLIKRGLVKGYISWERLMIVFSNVEPFPPINTTVL